MKINRISRVISHDNGAAKDVGPDPSPQSGSTPMVVIACNGRPLQYSDCHRAEQLYLLAAALTEPKAPLRAKAIRIAEALWNTFGSLVSCFTPREYANFFRHNGYSGQPERAIGVVALPCVRRQVCGG
jgi:hypothetical protein